MVVISIPFHWVVVVLFVVVVFFNFYLAFILTKFFWPKLPDNHLSLCNLIYFPVFCDQFFIRNL